MGSRYPAAKRYRKSRYSRNYGTGAKGPSGSRALYAPKTTSSGRTWPYQRPGISMVWDPFPAKATVIMRYNTTITLTSDVAGIAGYHLFRANSIFDPDQTGVGHQPYGRDIYAQIYNHYKVNSSTIVVTPVDAKTGFVGCTITDDTSVNLGFDNVKEVKGTRMIPMTSPGNNNGKVIQQYNSSQIFEPNYDTTGITAAMGNNPSEQSYFHVWFTPQLSTSTGDVKVNISISYNVSMWELQDLGQS